MEHIYLENIMYFLLFFAAYNILDSKEKLNVNPQINVGINFKYLHIQTVFKLSKNIFINKKEIESHVKALKGVVDAYWNQEHESLKVVFKRDAVNITTIKKHLNSKGYLPSNFLIA